MTCGFGVNTGPALFNVNVERSMKVNHRNETSISIRPCAITKPETPDTQRTSLRTILVGSKMLNNTQKYRNLAFR